MACSKTGHNRNLGTLWQKKTTESKTYQKFVPCHIKALQQRTLPPQEPLAPDAMISGWDHSFLSGRTSRTDKPYCKVLHLHNSFDS